MLLCIPLSLTGCVSGKYRLARKNTPPPSLLNVAFAPARLAATLNTVITYRGPGSWKREAFWDEYVVTLHNPDTEPLAITAVHLVDFAGTGQSEGNNPWKLESESKTLERKFRDAGVAFARNAGPATLWVGTEYAAAITSFMGGGGLSALGTAVVVGVPVYYVTVIVINQHNKSTVLAEFNRRRLVLPLTLPPGATTTGSFFFPMGPNPRLLRLNWSAGSNSGEAVLALDFLHGLHDPSVRAQPPPGAPLPFSSVGMSDTLGSRPTVPARTGTATAATP